jgi:hypothetical protein
LPPPLEEEPDWEELAVRAHAYGIALA